MACNLTWGVPSGWAPLPRDFKIERIKPDLRAAMDAPDVDCTVIRKYLALLESSTSSAWAHRFVTTNWDYLLQREILAKGYETLPKWLLSSHVFHLNGTVEILDSGNRSPFLLEEDLGAQRWDTKEANDAINAMLWASCIVVVGMSFECETDRFLLAALKRVEDDVPLGDAVVVAVNRDPVTLAKVSARIQTSLPRAEIMQIPQSFETWVEAGLSELRQVGILH